VIRDFVAKRPKRLPADELRAYGLKALGGRARSLGEMRRLLARRAAEPADVDRLLADFKDRGYLDDRKYAQSFSRYRLETQRLGKRRVERELRARYVAPQLAERAVEEAYRDVDEAALVREAIARRVRRHGPPKDEKALASLYRHLLGAGFAPATVIPQLRKLAKTDVEWPEE
jgi:regulatory protein